MKASLLQHLKVARALGICALALCIGAGFSAYQKKHVVTYLENSISQNVADVLALAEITDRNGADEVTEQIIADCGRREEYESYLIRLASLTKPELVTMQSLFESCGNFYGERKALMVTRLEQSVDRLKENITILSLLKDVGEYHAVSEAFSNLVTLEQGRSSLLVELADIQQDIITHLISGASAQSSEVTSLVAYAKNVSESLDVSNHQIDALRSTLVP